MNDLFDVWELVMAHLTPREAKCLMQVVRGLDVKMCKVPSLKETYYSTRRYGVATGADAELLADAMMIRRDYPQQALSAMKLRTTMCVEWVMPGQKRKTTVMGVLVRFGETLVLFNYSYFVREM
jgi:hypothetical protein